MLNGVDFIPTREGLVSRIPSSFLFPRSRSKPWVQELLRYNPQTKSSTKRLLTNFPHHSRLPPRSRKNQPWVLHLVTQLVRFTLDNGSELAILIRLADLKLK
jgi:hypothetical protein